MGFEIDLRLDLEGLDQFSHVSALRQKEHSEVRRREDSLFTYTQSHVYRYKLLEELPMSNVAF